MSRPTKARRDIPGPPARAVDEALDALAWMAQTVHQAHHREEGGTWEGCTRAVCMTAKLARDGLGEHARASAPAASGASPGRVRAFLLAVLDQPDLRRELAAEARSLLDADRAIAPRNAEG